jgi:hypothetical protein
MDTIADALVEAVLFIAFRSYDENASMEDFEEEDIQALENVKALLASASASEKQLLADAIDRALLLLPNDHERVPYYRAWMENMFGDNASLDPPTLSLE